MDEISVQTLHRNRMIKSPDRRAIMILTIHSSRKNEQKNALLDRMSALERARFMSNFWLNADLYQAVFR